jgi:hypothetical protein
MDNIHNAADNVHNDSLVFGSHLMNEIVHQYLTMIPEQVAGPDTPSTGGKAYA